MKFRVLCLATVAAAALSACAPNSAPKAPLQSGAALDTELLTLDTHLDTPANFGRAGWDIADRHEHDPYSQVDVPRMREGGLDGGFFAIYTAQGPLTPEGYAGARNQALMRAVQIHEMASRHRDGFTLAFAADDAAKIKAAHKRIVFQSIENSYPMGEDLSLFQTFYDLGVRLAGPVHFKNNQFADSATDAPKWHGLSPLGRQWVAEANRLGVVIDASHASDDVFDQLLALSKTPIILSHSGCRAIYDHPRNLDDARIRKLAASGGVIQINSVYLKPFPKLDAAGQALKDSIDDRAEHIWTLSAEEDAKLQADQRAFQAKYPSTATFDDFMANLLHALKVAGVDHVGLGADWDGGGGVIGMADVASLPKVNARLREAGYTEVDLQKIWGGNVLRVLRQAEAYKKQAAAKPA